MKQRGQIIPRGDNKYLLRVYVGRDGGGKRIYVSKTFEGTISAARKALTGLNSEKDTRTLVVPAKTDMRTFLRGWLDSKQDLSNRSRKQYRALIESKILPVIGSIRLTSLESQNVQRLINITVEKGYGPSTVAYVHRVLHCALDWACKSKLIHQNPADHIMRPKLERTVTTEAMYSAEEVQALIRVCRGPVARRREGERLGPLWVLLVGTGLRPGEAIALGWDSVVLDGPEPSVSVHRMSVQGKIVNEVKTVASRRTVSLPAFVVEALKTQRVEQAKNKLRFGPNYEDHGLVFATRMGRPLDVVDIGESWYRFVKRNKLRRIKMYNLRHTHATLLITKGADIRWVSARLGHSDIQITAQVYAHVTKEAHREMASVVDRAVGL
jgi:integrase